MCRDTFILIAVDKHGDIKEQTVKENFFQKCAVICSAERESGGTCNFYLLLPSQENGKAICKYGYLKDILNYDFWRREKSAASTSMVRVLTGETWSK